jgi:SAM-dependent methyltransferase
MQSSMSVNVQYGCGLCAPESWVNFDSSPTIFLQRIPIFGSLFVGRGFPLFPSNIKRGNITQRLPLDDNSVDGVYCSHVLEHLSLADLRVALAETHRILKPGAGFRFVLPDLEYYIRSYVESDHPNRALEFLQATILGVKERPRTISGMLREWFGGSKHLWMWDYTSMRSELESCGFTGIRRASFGDSVYLAFSEVEEANRWQNCLGIECSKPLV